MNQRMPNLTVASVALAMACGAASCSDLSSPTELRPEGPPMIRQVYITEAVPVGNAFVNRRAQLAFGDHFLKIGCDSDEDAIECDNRTGENATADASQAIRVVFDELLIGNALEEIACAGIVDEDNYDSVPLGATPDDIARCAGKPDEIKATCQGEYAVCVGSDPANPVGILDDNDDFAADTRQFITSAVTITCDGIEVPLDSIGSYYYPSGNQQPPSFGADITSSILSMGPALVLRPSLGLPTDATCTFAFDETVTDKQGELPCAADVFETYDEFLVDAGAAPNTNEWLEQDFSCSSPDNLGEISFSTDVWRVSNQSVLNNATGVARNITISLTLTIAPDPDTLAAGVTLREVGGADVAVTITPNATEPRTFLVDPNATLDATEEYELVFDSDLKNIFGQSFVGPFSLTFTTAN
ncbi:MAG: Ig-like domain-containing protein [Myxococcales bacterium]|nr:Ig-like domain-containing protein [Myxococcales bacterium]